MTKDSTKRIRMLYGILLSCALIIAGLCLMAACFGIYRSGEHPFSREAVAAAFSQIAVPVYLCLALILGGFILDLILPSDKKSTAPDAQFALILKRLYKLYDTSKMDHNMKEAVIHERKTRQLHWTIAAILLTIGSIGFITYAVNPDHFQSSQINESMIAAMCVMLPCLAVPFSYGIFAAFHAKASIQAEITLVKQAISAGCPKKVLSENRKESSVNWTLLARSTFLLIGIAILVYGFLAGGTLDVLTKAINICTECVGLG